MRVQGVLQCSHVRVRAGAAFHSSHVPSTLVMCGTDLQVAAHVMTLTFTQSYWFKMGCGPCVFLCRADGPMQEDKCKLFQLRENCTFAHLLFAIT